MGKRKLTTEQKIASYKKKRRIKIGIKILIATLIVAALIPATYFGYYYLVFTVFPGMKRLCQNSQWRMQGRMLSL